MSGRRDDGATLCVSYDEAVARYVERLDTVLRGFETGHAWLALWVPDEDPERGILSMLESAASSGLTSIEITLGAGTAAGVDAARLSALVGELAVLDIACEQGQMRIVAALRSVEACARAIVAPRDAVARPPEPALVGAASHDLHACFVQAALRAAAIAAHTGTLEGEGVCVEAALGEHDALALLVDPSTHLVRDARHRSASDEVRGVLETFCVSAIGVPVEEACEHGAHLTLDALRDRAMAAPVPGVLTPRNASPLLRRLSDAGAELLRAYVAATGTWRGDSVHRRAPSAAWLALDDAARLAAVRDALVGICAELDLARDSATCPGLRDVVKVRVDFADGVPVGARRSALLAIETALHALEPSLVCEREAKKDLNVIRRL